MKYRSSIHEFICDSYGTIFRVDRKTTLLVNEFIKRGLFFEANPYESTRTFKKQQKSRIPNFVCDPYGSVFCVDEKRTILVNYYIHLTSMLVSIAANDLEEHNTSNKPDSRHEHHRFILHRGPIKQRQYVSKQWLIAIVLKLLLVAWDLWTYRIGFKMINTISSSEYRNKKMAQ